MSDRCRQRRDPTTLGELGVYGGYELQDKVHAQPFALASTGTTIETHVTVGGGLSVSF